MRHDWRHFYLEFLKRPYIRIYDKWRDSIQTIKCWSTDLKSPNDRDEYVAYQSIFDPGDWYITPDNKAHGANMGPTWDRQHPGGPYVGHVNLAIWDTE